MSLCKTKGEMLDFHCPLLILFYLATLICAHDPKGTIEYQTVTNGKVALPCPLRQPHEQIAIVLWYSKHSSEVPIYTMDVRDVPLFKALHISSEVLKDRAYFDIGTSPPLLILNNITKDDEGEYRCRVDFKKSRSENYFLNLTVIVPSKEVNVMDTEGQRLEGVIGPYEEGTDLLLICEAEGGDPPPSVKWWRRGEIIDETYINIQGFVRNELHLTSLSREDLMAVLTCMVSNTDLVSPAEISVSLDLLLLPLDVVITNVPESISAGRRTELHCQSSGSRPPAQITWWKGSEKMINGKEKYSEDGNLTSSTISFIPGLEDNGKYVRCRSENLQMAKSVLEDGCLLNVHYVPRLSLALGTSLRRDTIREGADVYFECNIMANPWVSEVSWLFEEQMLFSDPSAGIIVANQSLVLQKVKRRHRGRYRCLGTNQEGTGRSKDVFLRINYAPICKLGQRFIYALARNEEASVQCEMDGDPPDAQFKWIFNNSQENNEIHSFTSNGTLSVLTYVPRTRFDFGTLVCTAENNLGPATEPCLFQIVPAGPPDAVSNCLLLNQTTESMQVECSSKDAGGLKPFFFLEVYDSVQRLLANLTNWDSPHFYVANLSPGTFYTLNIYAANSKGRSLPRRIKGATRSTPERHTGQEGTPLAIVSPLIGCLIAVVGGLLIVTGTIILVVKTRRNGNGEDNDESPNEENGKNNEPEDGNNGFTCNTLDLTSFKQTSKEIGFLKASINSVECQQINRGFYKQGFSKQSNLIRAAKPLNCLPPYNNDQLHPEISSHLRVSSSFQAGPERLSYDNLSIPSVISNGSSKRVAISHPLQPINCPDVDLYPGYRLGKQIKENCSDGDKSASSCCLDDFAELHISPMVKPDY